MTECFSRSTRIGPTSTHRAPRCAGAPQDRPQARQQLADRKRLRHVVVRAGVERGDLLVVVADGRDEDDRRAAPRAQLPADVTSRAVGQQQVEDHRVRRTQRRRGQRLLRRRGGVDLVARAAQVRIERPKELRLVVDDEDARLHDATRAGTRSHGQRQPRARTAARLRGASSTVAPFASAKPRAIARPMPEPGRTCRAALVEHSTAQRRRRVREHVDVGDGVLERVVEHVHEHALDLRRRRLRRAEGRRRSTSANASLSRTSETARGSSSSTRPEGLVRRRGARLSRERSSRFSTSRVSRVDLQRHRLEQRRRGRPRSIRARLLCEPSTAAAIVASGVRKSCETLCSMAVLIASERRTRVGRSRSSANASSAATPPRNGAVRRVPAAQHRLGARGISSSGPLEQRPPRRPQAARPHARAAPPRRTPARARREVAGDDGRRRDTRRAQSSCALSRASACAPAAGRGS